MLRFLHIGPVFVPYLLNFGELFPKCLAISKKCPTFALANKKHRGVEQLVARQAHNLEVARSSRTPATKQGLSFIGRGLFLWRRGRRMQSPLSPCLGERVCASKGSLFRIAILFKIILVINILLYFISTLCS